MASKQQIRELADRLISTLDTLMPSEKADAIVRDVAEGLYRDVLGLSGKIVVDTKKPNGFAHGSFGNGKRVAVIARYRFEEVENG